MASFKNYVFHPLPDLGSQHRLPSLGPCSIAHKISPGFSKRLISPDGRISPTAQSQLRAAFASMLMRYLDRQDYLFAEASTVYLQDPEGVLLRPIRARLDSELAPTWNNFVQMLITQADSVDEEVCLDDARLELGIIDEQNPIRAVFVWDIRNVGDDAFLPNGIIFGAHVDGFSVVIDLLADSALISASTIEILAAQVSVTLDAIISSPNSPPKTPQNALPSPLLSCAPQTCDLDHEHLVLEWLFDHAAKRPDAIAHEIYASMDKPPRLLTYGEYNRQSNILARWLVTNGIHVEDKVALCSLRTSHFYIIMAAILKAGGCYVSIDPELPAERKRFIVEDSGARWVFAAPEDASIFGDVAIPTTTDFMERLEADFNDSNICLATLSSLAYLLYTSGTTGNPKGCLLTHRGLYWAMDAFCALPKPVTNPDTDKRLALASTAFDVHISEIVQSWCLGSRLVSAPRFELLTQLRQHIISIGVTHIGMVPSMIEALLESPEGLPIKYLVSGGEKITDSLLKKWSARADLVLANFYGPTEATIGCTSRQIGMNDRKENIGRAFPSCSAYVVDRDLNTVPLGCPGELVISGPLVARGYHNLPDVTSKVFIDYPSPGCKAYRTGDLVRMMPDHSIEIMGRIDSQVKYRGVRIETEGISSILQAAGADKKLTVSTFITTHPAVGAQELLVSFFALGNDVSVVDRRSSIPSLVQTDDAKALVQTLKAAVQVQLPAYMRPAYILPVEFIPLSLNGKTDTKVLARVFRSLDMRALLGN
ncbi:hypothetical protein IW262DRAFT_1334699 [Armillaria fumosa]|nr:hypothetical protein IW262DRAFT_1334699 [Armillaria fumosa]